MRLRLAALLTVIGLLAVPATGQAYLTGIGDQMATMFLNPYYTRIIDRQPQSHRISRYIAPYDVANGQRKNAYFLDEFKLWYQLAQRNHVQVLVAFYHSELTATKMPTVATYSSDVHKFMKLFPKITTYQPWNEENRGNVAHMFSSPTALQAAQYYLALRKLCPKCTDAGLDVLDAQSIKPTLTYIQQFDQDVQKLHGPLPTLWGLHNYSDTNRFSSSRTRAVLAAVKGQVWLTETGGIVQLGTSFTNKKGAGLTRAVKALNFMFSIAASQPRITRLYIFQWTGSSSTARFDAGLTNPNGTPRPGYYDVCNHILRNAKLCNTQVPKSKLPPVTAAKRTATKSKPSPSKPSPSKGKPAAANTKPAASRR